MGLPEENSTAPILRWGDVPDGLEQAIAEGSIPAIANRPVQRRHKYCPLRAEWYTSASASPPRPWGVLRFPFHDPTLSTDEVSGRPGAVQSSQDWSLRAGARQPAGLQPCRGG